MEEIRDTITVLHVDDDEAFTELVAEFLERESERLAVVTATSASEGLDRLSEGDIDCVVSDYQMPEMDGLEFLERVRERDPDRPFILFTGKGSEEIAAEAVSAGVTDYLQKEAGTEQYALLANRIENVVAQSRYERALEASERRYRQLVEQSPDAIVVYQETVVYANEAAADLLGADAAPELYGREPAAFDHSDGGVLDATVREAAAADDPLDWREGRVVGLDGDTRHVETTGSAVTYEGAPAVQVVLHDVTERRRREAELERAKERFRTIFEASNDAMLIVDPDTETIRAANPQATDLLGYSREELVSAVDPVSDLHPEDGTEFEAFAERVIEEGEGRTRTFTCQHTDGHLIPVEVSAATFDFDDECCLLVNVRDIGDRVRREEALDALHEATRELMGATDKEAIATIAARTAREILDLPRNGIWLYDEADDALRPAAVTEEATAAVGDQPAFTGGDSLAWQAFREGEIHSYDDVRTVADRHAAEPAIRSELILPLGDQGVMLVGSTAVGAFDDLDASLARILAANTEAALARADREARLREKRTELERQNERLDEFASLVSHDLRNPLNIADGYLDLVADDCDSEHLPPARAAIDRMDGMIEDLLALARQGRAVEETEPVALDAVVRECWDTIATADADIVVDTDLTVEADRSRLRHLLENLLRNAVEHTDRAVTVRVGALDGGDGFYVEDDGPGIPEGEHERVFEAGYTDDGGIGVGLKIVAEVVAAHGWEVAVTEGAEGGARFEVTGVTLAE
ncbi:MAG: PAS domain S-box protein [Halobacteriaceae archaeon]